LTKYPSLIITLLADSILLRPIENYTCAKTLHHNNLESTWEDGRIMLPRIGFNQKTLSLFVMIAVLVFSVVQPVYATPVFGIEKNLSSNAGSSVLPKISVSGSNVYAVWQDITSGNDEVLFKASTDSGTNFGVEKNLSESIASSTAPKIASADNNVYVTWIEGTEILFKASTDNGATFGSSIPLSITAVAPVTAGPQITAAGSNVYVVWRANSEIYFSASIDNGANFGVEKNLSNTIIPTSFVPQVAAAGNSVYVVWHDGAPADILFRASTDNGNTFNPPLTSAAKNLSETPVTSTTAQIAAVDSKVYVVWQEGTPFDINFKVSTDNGATFGGVSNLSDNTGTSTIAQISAVDSKVYVVWQDGAPADILFKASSDSGASFGGEKNLSGDLGASSAAQVAISGSNVYVAWQDSTTTDILSKSSSNNGATFGGVTNLSGNAGASTIPQISAIGTNVYVLWQDNTPTNNDILFKAGTDTPVEIVFDQSNYRLTDTATVTVTDQAANTDSGLAETITVTMTSTLDPPTGIILTLDETGDASGIFDGSFTFTTIPPSAGTTLLAAPGNIITASYGGLTSTSNIFPRTVAFDVSNYGLSDIAHITVTDQNSNLDDSLPEIISVHVTTNAQPGGIDLSLTETGDDSGIFGGPASNLIFMPGNYLTPISSTITINQHDEDDNANPNLAETTTVKVISSSDTTGITLTLTETGIDTDEFSGVLSLTIDSSVAGSSIKVAEGDFLTITHKSFFATKFLITPNPNPANGAIQVFIPDTVTATYLGAPPDSETVTTTDAPGGGAGGISRAGFVVNFLAGAGGGGSGGNSPPTFGTSSFAIISGGEEGFGGIISDNDAKTVEETKTFKVGEKAVLRLDLTEGGGIGHMEHVGFYINIRDGQKRQDSDAYIYYDPLKSPQLTIHDPNGRFSEVNFDLLQKDATHFVLKYELTFAKPMAKSDIILESWNLKKWSSINKIPNAIEVLSSGILQEEQSEEPIVETFTEDVTDAQVIPVWVKSNAKWWSDGTIDNDTFISGIEHLVNEGVIKVSLQATNTASISEVQPWIKNTAGWWADDMISEDEFVTAIEWLISNNIIEVAA